MAKASMDQFKNQALDANAKFALIRSGFKNTLQVAYGLRLAKKSTVKWLATDSLKVKSCADLSGEATASTSRTWMPSSENFAFIQYSLGSTGTPKVVIISHGALVYNLHAIKRVFVVTAEDKTMGISWLLQYHEYGLINYFLMSVNFSQNPSVCCSPVDFIKNPLLWSDMIEMFGGTHIAGPNFAYALLCKRMKAAGRTPQNTCSICRVNIAAKPIAEKTLKDMEEIGFPKSCINPCYGLSENCVYVTSCLGNEVNIGNDVFVSCGLVARHEALQKQVAIVKDGQVANKNVVGEIHIRGPDLASGYWNKPELTEAIFKAFGNEESGYYMATGDLGKIDAKGCLYVCGQSKELIIVNGRNVYPTDLERTIESEYPTIVRPGSTVTLQWKEDSVAMAIEVRKTVTQEQLQQTLKAYDIKSLISSAHGVNVSAIFVLPQGSVPKTMSGKVKRV